VDAIQGILTGFEVILTPVNLAYVFVGVLLGMVVGILPGLGPVATIAILLPLTYSIPPESAIIMLAGIYYGSAYGGTITSVLLRLPGEAATVVAAFDGYPMARQGRAGPALGIAAIGSFVGGVIGVAGLTFLAPVLAGFALNFGPPEYAALAVLGILLVAYIGSQSVTRSVISAAFGLLLATIGEDPVTGSSRLTFGITDLLGGVDIVPIAMGLFGIGEILHNLEQQARGTLATSRVSNIWPSMRDWIQSRGAILRGSVVGFFIGILPGAGATIASLTSYALEKRRSREPERFGKGAIEGVAGPETSNNAAATSSFVPLLTLGIPGSATTAILYGALLLQNITPGPLLVSQNPEIFWGVITSMIVGNLMLLVLNIPLIGLFIQVLRVRLSILAPLVVVVTMIGSFSLNNSVFDIWLVLAFGALGYMMKKYGFEPAPLVLAFVLGPILETAFRQSMLISDGSLGIFVTRPISGLLLAVMLVIVARAILQLVRKRTRRGQSVG
jgi:putative tricarboxylic transport membrane protein